MDSLHGVQRSLGARLEASPLPQRWRALAPSDRLALGGLAVFLAALSLYLLVWQPTQQGLARAREAFEQQRALHTYLQAQAPRARSLAGRSQAPVDPARLQGLVTASAAQQGLAVERLDSDANGALQVALQPAPFGQLLRWFAVLEEQGVRIAEAGLDRSEADGVGARLTLRVGP
ncbi:type II secretion system protein M [Pseudomonas zhanjiangensis]|uniref:Type II secretion system protein M n=1 Tax=Pseudomonas zhanjiangensis TaxID=3239015 RepID=A0ABV3YSM8_9PSED